MIRVEARGLVCPAPVIETKKVLRDNASGEDVVVSVDNLIATQNLSKMAEQMKLNASVVKLSEDNYEVTISKKEEAEADAEGCKLMMATDSYVVAIGSSKMGDGDEELGKKLLEGFIYSLTEQDVRPDKVVFYNSGVFMSSVNEKSVEDLKKLRESGTEILSCGMCLNYYKLTEKLQVGEITNMYRITEILRSNHVVRP